MWRADVHFTSPHSFPRSSVLFVQRDLRIHGGLRILDRCPSTQPHGYILFQSTCISHSTPLPIHRPLYKAQGTECALFPWLRSDHTPLANAVIWWWVHRADDFMQRIRVAAFIDAVSISYLPPFHMVEHLSICEAAFSRVLWRALRTLNGRNSCTRLPLRISTHSRDLCHVSRLPCESSSGKKDRSDFARPLCRFLGGVFSNWDPSKKSLGSSLSHDNFPAL